MVKAERCIKTEGKLYVEKVVVTKQCIEGKTDALVIGKKQIA